MRDEEKMARNVVRGAYYSRDMAYATWWVGRPKRIVDGFSMKIEDPDEPEGSGKCKTVTAKDSDICREWVDICRRWNISPDEEENFTSGHGMLGEGCLADSALQKAALGEEVYG